jgi:hypothetical protein
VLAYIIHERVSKATPFATKPGGWPTFTRSGM